MMTQKEVNELLEAAKPKVIESLKEEIAKTITYDVTAAARKAISDHVAEWVAENVIPEVTRQLFESKDGMISVGVKLADNLSDELVKSMTTTVAENLKQSWTRREVLQKLFS